ncbi:MAG: hypothetical protein NXI28_20260 [bacterium]|nr:hypothetical protein [bacterium]
MPKRSEVIVCLIIACTVAGLVASPILNARPAGDPIPRDAPNPANRIDTGLGASLILPEHWIVSGLSIHERKSDPKSYNTFTAFPQTAYDQRPDATLQVHRCLRDPDFEQLPVQTVYFGDGTAQQFVQVYETNSIPIVSSVNLFVEHNAQWYRITYVYNGTLTKCPPSVQAFLETISFEAFNGG